MNCSIIIPVHNGWPFLRKCIDSIVDKTISEHQIVVVDDGSDDETAGHIRHLHELGKINKLIRNQTAQGFTNAVNRGLMCSGGYDYVCLLNSDTVVVTPYWIIDTMACGARSEKIGILGVLSNQATYQSVGKPVVPDEDVHKYGKFIVGSLAQCHPEISLVNGFAYFIKKSVLDKVGFLDEKTFPHYGSEDDYTLQAAAAGFKSVLADSVYVYHHNSQSYGKDKKHAMCVQYWNVLHDKWGKTLDDAVTQTVEATAYLREIKP
jgi:GT2 family glycosyltransferase